MRSLFSPTRRVIEATPQQLMTVGAYHGGVGGVDPIDGDRGYARVGHSQREVPSWTAERARSYSVAAYRINPLAKAIIDTMTAFCTGSTGVTLQVSSDDVREVAEEFWDDDENGLFNQELFLRDLMIMGEQCFELMQGETSGVVRINPIDVSNIIGISLRDGNVLWADKVIYQYSLDKVEIRTIVRSNEETGNLREGEAMFFAPWKTTLQDTRSTPFLMPILDQLDNYDQVMANLVDRTTLARYLVWDVSVDGTPRDVEEYVKNRGRSMPESGGIEFHNKNIEWKPMTVSTGAQEDSIANRSIMTQIAGGSGISKPWLGEPGDANRATSLSMAEPVRRRVEGVQKMWTRNMTELVRFAVDRAVAAKRIPDTVKASDQRTGYEYEVPASKAVQVVGPEIAAADAQINAEVMLNLAKSLESMVMVGALSHAGAQVAAKKAWEDYVGVPYTADLNDPDAEKEELANYIADKLQAQMVQTQFGQTPKNPLGGDDPTAPTSRKTTPGGSGNTRNMRRAGKSVKPGDSTYSKDL